MYKIFSVVILDDPILYPQQDQHSCLTLSTSHIFLSCSRKIDLWLPLSSGKKTPIFGLDKHSVEQIFLETNQNKSIWPKNKEYLFSLQTFVGLQSNGFFSKMGKSKSFCHYQAFQVQFMEHDVLLECICNFFFSSHFLGFKNILK